MGGLLWQPGALANTWLGRGPGRIQQDQAGPGREDVLLAAALEAQRPVLRS